MTHEEQVSGPSIVCGVCHGEKILVHHTGPIVVCSYCCGNGIIVDMSHIMNTCQTCHGYGFIGQGSDHPQVVCSYCRGKGEVMAETINHPAHYNQGKFEVIDVIEDWGLGFNDGNAVKYIARHKHKENPEENLKKALWYLVRELRVKYHVEVEVISSMILTVVKLPLK